VWQGFQDSLARCHGILSIAGHQGLQRVTANLWAEFCQLSILRLLAHPATQNYAESSAICDVLQFPAGSEGFLSGGLARGFHLE